MYFCILGVVVVQAVVNHLKWVQETKLGFSVRVTCALNCGTISPVPKN